MALHSVGTDSGAPLSGAKDCVTDEGNEFIYTPVLASDGTVHVESWSVTPGSPADTIVQRGSVPTGNFGAPSRPGAELAALDLTHQSCDKAYVANLVSNTITTLNINPDDGSLTKIGDTAIPAGLTLGGLAVSNQRRPEVFVSTDQGKVLIFDIDPRNGALEVSPSEVDTGTGAPGAGMAQVHNTLFVTVPALNQIAQIDLSKRALDHIIPVNLPSDHSLSGLAPDPVGGVVYGGTESTAPNPTQDFIVELFRHPLRRKP